MIETRSKFGPHLEDIRKWRSEGKTFDQIVALLPAALNPKSRVIASLLRRQRNKKPDPEFITIPKETFKFLLDTLSTLLSEKSPSSKTKLQLSHQIDVLQAQIRPQRSIAEQARANSDKALALAEKLKAEQAEIARKAAQTKPRSKLNQDRIDLPPR